jgi:uncharacterized membrane protein (DUF4010 family)
MAELSRQEEGLELMVAAEAVVLAALSNTVVRTAMVFVTGSTGLRRYMLPAALLAIAVTISIALWLRAS